jgi:hypothetical protein
MFPELNAPVILATKRQGTLNGIKPSSGSATRQSESDQQDKEEFVFRRKGLPWRMGTPLFVIKRTETIVARGLERPDHGGAAFFAVKAPLLR